MADEKPLSLEEAIAQSKPVMGGGGGGVAKPLDSVTVHCPPGTHAHVLKWKDLKTGQETTVVTYV